jgi:hypothetical protein
MDETKVYNLLEDALTFFYDKFGEDDDLELKEVLLFLRNKLLKEEIS